MMDFKPYDDLVKIIGYDGFIDQKGNFYKVCPKRKKSSSDSHNLWAEAYMREKFKISDFKISNDISTLLALSKLSGPAEVLINCFGYIYYSHDPFYYAPIIKLPNPKISKYTATKEQLDMLYEIMYLNNENVDIPIFYEDNKTYDYCDIDEYKFKRH